MKITELKQLIKESVKEVFNEELKNIILEALKKNDTLLTENKNVKHTINEKHTNVSINENTNHPVFDRESLRKLVGGGQVVTTNNINTTPVDPIDGILPSGEVNLQDIMKLTGRG